jgi:hypothetical protein
MSRDAIMKDRRDEDTQPFLGHLTLQVHDEPEAEPEQNPDGPIRRQPGPERVPSPQEDQKRRKGDKPNRDRRK